MRCNSLFHFPLLLALLASIAFMGCATEDTNSGQGSAETGAESADEDPFNPESGEGEEGAETGDLPCVPNCTLKQCGADGCGGTCGACPQDEYCSDKGECFPNGCEPDCEGKQCGDNGCGGSCGGCGENFECNGSGQCECGPKDHFNEVNGKCLPSCGALLAQKGLPDTGQGCCNSGCTTAQAGGPGSTWDCTYCCASSSNTPSCSESSSGGCEGAPEGCGWDA